MENSIWQAPGNSTLFNARLEDDNRNEKSYTRDRTFWVLKFFDENFGSLFLNQEELDNKLYRYLETHYESLSENKSTKSHFYRPLIFFGLLLIVHTKDNKIRIYLSYSGREFLNNWVDKKYDKCMEMFLISIMNTTYPNYGAPKTDGGFFPFRILFYLIKSRGEISKKEISNAVVLISKIDQLNNFDVFSETNDFDLSSTTKNIKYVSWILPTLVNLDILCTDLRDKTYFLSDKANKLIERLYKWNDLNLMFFDINDFTSKK
jgi:5-methylcytosine-specific restriction protein A